MNHLKGAGGILNAGAVGFDDAGGGEAEHGPDPFAAGKDAIANRLMEAMRGRGFARQPAVQGFVD